MSRLNQNLMEDLITFQKQRIASLEAEVQRLQLELAKRQPQRQTVSFDRNDPNFNKPLSQLNINY